MTPFLSACKSLAFGGLMSLLVAGSALAGRPNILLITADDMNWDSVGVYGCPVEETTPNIDRLASEGIQFDYGYVQIAICTPSRQVMLSGSHSHQTMTRCFTELERVGPALPDVLKQSGYHVANINKQQNFYDWDTAIKETESGFGRDVPFHGEAVRGIIETAGEKPWFIMANFNDPHRPFHGSDRERDWVYIYNPWVDGITEVHNEWCYDIHRDYPSGIKDAAPDTPATDPLSDADNRVLRGAAFDARASILRSASRGPYRPSSRSSTGGFRPTRNYNLSP